MVLCLGVTFGTVKPFLTAGRADADLCVENVFTVAIKALAKLFFVGEIYQEDACL